MKKLSTGLVRGVLLDTLVKIELRAVNKCFKHNKNKDIKMGSIRRMPNGYP